MALFHCSGQTTTQTSSCSSVIPAKDFWIRKGGRSSQTVRLNSTWKDLNGRSFFVWNRGKVCYGDVYLCSPAQQPLRIHYLTYVKSIRNLIFFLNPSKYEWTQKNHPKKTQTNPQTALSRASERVTRTGLQSTATEKIPANTSSVGVSNGNFKKCIRH